MNKHLTLVGIINIVHRSLVIVLSLILYGIAFCFFPLLRLMANNYPEPHQNEIPPEILSLGPAILIIIATVLLLFSLFAIIGAIGVLKKKNWGRIIILIVSFINLLDIPIGTALGIYSIWVLMKDETIKQFHPDMSDKIIAKE